MTGSADTQSNRKLETRVERLLLRDLDLLEQSKNARYMEKPEFDQLVSNVRNDGCLTSTPLVYRGKVYSGNHRTKAAIVAGIEEADCLVMLGWRVPGKEDLEPVSDEELLAIQLSHNSIAGKDDPNILRQLFASFDSLGLKAYSGLTDDQFKENEEKLASMGIKRPKYEELQLVFLPEDQAVVRAWMERIEKLKRQPTILVGHLADFDNFFNALVAVKQKRNIINNAAALHLMARVTLDWLVEQDKAAKAKEHAGVKSA